MMQLRQYNVTQRNVLFPRSLLVNVNVEAFVESSIRMGSVVLKWIFYWVAFVTNKCIKWDDWLFV